MIDRPIDHALPLLLDHKGSIQGRRAEVQSAAGEETLNFNDSYDNATFTAAVCNLSTSTLSLTINVDFSAVKWFRLPGCVSTWPSLSLVTLINCQMPNFTLLPPSITSIVINFAVGQWSQSDTGTNTGVYGGYFDWNWITALPNLRQVTITASKVNGTLPNHLSHAKLTQFTLDSNRLTGTISPDFFVKYPALWSFSVSVNSLSGTIPYYGLEALVGLSLSYNAFTHWPPLVVNATAGFRAPTQIAYISLSHNQLVQLPSDADFQSMTVLSGFSAASNPTLRLPFPKILSYTIARPHPSLLLATIDVSGSGFTGSLLDIPPIQTGFYNAYPYPIDFIFQNNSFTGSIPSSWTGISFRKLSLNDNPGLNGTLAAIDANGFIVSQFVKNVTQLTLGPSQFTGPMFNISSMTGLTSIQVSGKFIDFCALTPNVNTSEVIFPSTSLITCVLRNTSAGQCAWAYPETCLVDLHPRGTHRSCPCRRPCRLDYMPTPFSWTNVFLHRQ